MLSPRARRNRMFGPLKLRLEEIELVTNNFADANFIGEGFLGKIYKGQLALEGGRVDVAVRRLDHSFWLQELAFEKEISILSRLKHRNMVSIVGFCYENNEMLIINERVARGSLRFRLSDPELTWMRRLQISVGAVSALSYLHSCSIIHHNINADTILLDENWEAKISGFEYSMTIQAGTLDLAYEKLGMGTHKSDVFSMGIVLFKLLCGDTFFSKEDNSFQASSARYHYENRDLHKFVDPDLFSQMNSLSFNIFSKTAYNCLNQQRKPPNMNEVFKRLERAFRVQQMHENNGRSTVAFQRTLPDHLKLKLESLKHMRIRLDDILTATGNFSKGHIVSTGGFGSVYTAELEHVDRESCMAIERENEREILKKRSIVAIKNIEDTDDEIAVQGFYAEIEMLMSCKHSNIITLVGFCDERGAMILIYEYASNGNLSYYLQNVKDNHNDGWTQRLKICIDAAKGLSFLHTTGVDRQEIVHRDIKSANILLDENLEAKIGDFGLSIFPSISKEHYNTQYINVVGTPVYMDPQYLKDAKLKNKSDVYSFGVVLLEILCGTVAYHKKYEYKGLALVGRQHFENRLIMEMVDPKMKEEITKTLFTSVKGPSKKSLDTFTKIAYECLAEEQDDRPTMENVLKELHKALLFQESRDDILRISAKDIPLALDDGKDFSHGKEYIGKVSHADGNISTVTVKDYKDYHIFARELEVGRKYRHENVICLLGYCEEEEKGIIVYEHALNGSLADHLDNPDLTWSKRLKICIGIAAGLAFLHGGLVTGEVVIHRFINSSSILLDADMKAKINDLGFSRIVLEDPQDYRIPSPWDRKVKEDDIYAFGNVLFDVMLLGLASSLEPEKKENYLEHLVKYLIEKGRVDELVYESKNEHVVPQSLTVFKDIASQCLSSKREKRPTAGEVMIQLKHALDIQEKGLNVVQFSFEDIKNATDNFNNDNNCIGVGGYGNVYKGQLSQANGHKNIVAKRFVGDGGEGDSAFYREIQVIVKFKHKNVIGLVGYCDEMDERIIVYEYASNGSLDWLLDSIILRWMKRLEICIDVANGLEFLHRDVLRQEAVIHRNVKSRNILLTQDWEAKITDLGRSLIIPNNQQIDYVIDKNITGTSAYTDPTYMKTGRVSKASDIYTFGVVLFEILCGRCAYPTSDNENDQEYLGPLAKNYYEETKLDELVFEGIKEQIVPESLSTFANIAYRCLHDDPDQRPTASEVLELLNKAKEHQVDGEIWEPKLPSDYKEIIQQSRAPGIYDSKKKKDLYDILCEGILIKKGKVWFALDSNGIGNVLISATLFTYQNPSLQKWRNNRKSRFQRVPLMTDISNLKIQAKIKTQFLTPSVIYGVYLVFKFVEANKISSEPKYVNLKYKMENKTLHAYFATWRKDKWMTIELYRFFNHKDNGDFEVLLESFSRCYCGSDSIYIEGIEFRAVDNMTREEIEKSKDVQQIMRSNSKRGTHQIPAENEEVCVVSRHSDEDSKPREMNGKRHHMLSANEALYDSSNVKLFKLKPSGQSRFREVIEVLSQQVFRIKCKIYEFKLSPDTDYRCYLVFKLSEKCHGLHCPVKVRGVHRPVKVGLPHQSKKETKALYFRTPKAWNIHDIDQVPKQREDGWMEVNVWKFNSQNQLRNDEIHLNLKLISYEGTMSGLIVCGLEIRPM